MWCAVRWEEARSSSLRYARSIRDEPSRGHSVLERWTCRSIGRRWPRPLEVSMTRSAVSSCHCCQHRAAGHVEEGIRCCSERGRRKEAGDAHLSAASWLRVMFRPRLSSMSHSLISTASSMPMFFHMSIISCVKASKSTPCSSLL